MFRRRDVSTALAGRMGGRTKIDRMMCAWRKEWQLLLRAFPSHWQEIIFLKIVENSSCLEERVH